MTKLTDFQLRYLEKEVIECDDIAPLLCDYADGDLTPSLMARMENHARCCESCQKLMDTYLLTVKLASELRDPPMPRGVQDRLRRRLNASLGLSLPMVEGGE